MEKFPSNFCIIPWIGADVRPQGGVSLCCVAQEHLLDDNRDPSELETIRQNKNFTRIRQQFLKGEWPKECNYCQSYDKDEHSGYSLRKMYNQRFGLEQMAPHEFTDEAKDLMQLELNFGNICNYKCRMCSSQYSSKWMSDEAALHGYSFTKKVNAGNYDIDNLVQQMTHLKELVVKGGEPFINPNFEKFINLMVEKNIAQNCHIYIVTNGSVYNQNLLSQIEKFKHAHIAVSIDGVDPVYSYIRDGSHDFKGVLSNLKEMFNHKKIFLSINYTLQIYNMLCLRETYDQISPYAPQLDVIPVHQSFLQVIHAPEPLKDILRQDLNYIISKFRGGSISIDRIKGARIDIDKPGIASEWQQFHTFTSNLDRVRKQNLLEIEPRFAAFYGQPLCYDQATLSPF